MIEFPPLNPVTLQLTPSIVTFTSYYTLPKSDPVIVIVSPPLTDTYIGDISATVAVFEALYVTV